MEIALSSLLNNDTTLLQQIIVDVSADRIAFKIEMDVHVLAKSRTVVIAIGFGIAESFKDRIRLKKDVFHSKKNTNKRKPSFIAVDKNVVSHGFERPEKMPETEEKLERNERHPTDC